jgi:hypothetical protein
MRTRSGRRVARVALDDETTVAAAGAAVPHFNYDCESDADTVIETASVADVDNELLARLADVERCDYCGSYEY